MKKSLLLSIVMTLVLVVAMSTATFAWYVSNGTVTTGTATITAGVADGNILISNNNVDFDTTADFTVATKTLKPTAPSAVITYSNKGTAWVTGEVSNGVTTTTAADATNVFEGKFWLLNDGAKAMSVSVDVDAASAAKLATGEFCYIVFIGETLVATGGYDYVAAGEGETPETQAATTAPATIAADGNAVEVIVLAWVNGVDVNNADQGGSFTIDLTFSGSEVA